MQQEAGRTDTPREGLHAALLDYARSPGKYPVAQRQPALLFASIREILHIAIGRDADNKAAQEAACFFIRSALFYAGADHYALLGMAHDADAAALKDRYRLLMRLIHPDFSLADASSWPADSAVRVNMAHDVLSSPLRRRDYDAALAAAQHRPHTRVEHRRIDLPRRVPAGLMSRSGYKKIVVVCGAAGGLVLGGLFMSGRDGVQLVQRRTVPKGPVAVVAPAPAPIVVATMAPLQQLIVATAQPLPTPAVEIAMAPPPPPPPPRAAIVAPAPTPKAAKTPVIAPPPIVVAAAPVAVPVAVPVMVVAPPPPPAPLPPQPAPPPPPPRPAPVAGLSLAEAQPLLSVLLQHLESGRGERLINMLEREARSQPGVQALSRNYERLIEGMRPVRLSHVDFKAEPADGRLLVVGNIGLQGGEQNSPGKKIVVRAEFASRAGSVVMIGLSGEPGN